MFFEFFEFDAFCPFFFFSLFPSFAFLWLFVFGLSSSTSGTCTPVTGNLGFCADAGRYNNIRAKPGKEEKRGLCMGNNSCYLCDFFPSLYLLSSNCLIKRQIDLCPVYLCILCMSSRELDFSKQMHNERIQF